MRSLIISIGLVCLLAGNAAAQNFTGASEEILLAAERARIHSAEYWSGQPLPGMWSAPCPITVRYVSGNGGQTTFTFDRGEVFGWRMEVQGSRESILRDVIPHEVDHTVRATLVRRPQPRWLDEGASSLFESEPERVRLHDNAHQAARWFDERHLDLMEYPQDPQRVHETYGAGLTLVETLLERGPPTKLITFARDPRPVREKLPDHYGITDRELIVCWRRHLQICPPSRCYVPWPGPLQQAQPPQQAQPIQPIPDTRQPMLVDNRQLLEVWSQHRCPPCEDFWRQYNTIPAFKNALDARYRVCSVILDKDTLARADEIGIDGTPTFTVDGKIKSIGFTDQASLWRDLLPAPRIPSNVPPSTPRQTTPVPSRPAVEPQPTPAQPPQQIAGEQISALNGRVCDLELQVGELKRVLIDLKDSGDRIDAKIANLLILVDSIPSSGQPGPPGPPGPPGEPGPIGASPTPEAVAEAMLVMIRNDPELLALLRGPAGEKGEDGADAPDLSNVILPNLQELTARVERIEKSRREFVLKQDGQVRARNSYGLTDPIELDVSLIKR